MIEKSEILRNAREQSVGNSVVERDYALGSLLWGIGEEPALSEGLAFKGGTCIRKCYIDNYRFSEDLDFTATSGGPTDPEKIMPALYRILDRVQQTSGIDCGQRAPQFRSRPDGASIEGRVYFRGPLQSPVVTRVKIDISTMGTVVLPTVARDIIHHYTDDLPAPAIVQCYDFVELFAEKIRAMGERSRPRDLYDVVTLFRSGIFQGSQQLVSSTYTSKCRVGGVPVYDMSDVLNSPNWYELHRSWHTMLRRQMPDVPPIEEFEADLARLYQWLQ